MKSFVSWFVHNPVAANLIMVVLVLGGLLTLPTVTKEFFPDFSLDLVRISVVYRGAAPEEVEEGVSVRIEEAIADIEGIKRITSISAEGFASVSVELDKDADNDKATDEIKNRVDAIDTFPEEADKPIVEEVTNIRGAIDVAIYGDTDRRTLKRIAERVRDEITQLPDITNAELSNAPPWEVSIEVAEEDLRRHGLTFSEVAEAVRRSSIDVPGGQIKTDAGQFLLRAEGQAYVEEEFNELVLLTAPDGTRIRLGAVARVVDGFEDTDQFTYFDDSPAIIVQVFRIGDQSLLAVTEQVKDYVDEARGWLPEGVEIATFKDESIPMRGRINLLQKNAFFGLMLVFAVLALFLRFRLAFWVSLGIPICFLGTFLVMPTVDVTINMISLFAFLVVLGIVVDDAIIVGESIFTWQQRSGKGIAGAIEGASRVGTPVIFAVLTTIAAFWPILNVEGNTGKIMRVIPLIVIPTLLFSLVESLMILPAHLRHIRGPRREGTKPWLAPFRAIRRGWERVQSRFDAGLQWFIGRVYRPSLELGLKLRYVTLAVGVVTLLLTLGLVGGGYVKFVFFPDVEADFVGAQLEMPLGVPVERTEAAVEVLVAEAQELRDEIVDEYGEDAFTHVIASIGNQPLAGAQAQNSGEDSAGQSGSHLAEVTIELVPSEERDVTSNEVVRRWRERVGAIPEAQKLAFTAAIFSPGEDINLQLTHPRIGTLETAAARLKDELERYEGVYDIGDSYQAGKPELELDVKPEAQSLGIKLADLGRQVRQAFFGEEAQRVQRGRDDVRVMVRYPEEERRSLADLSEMRIRTPEGGEVPFGQVAEVRLGEGYSSIKRVDRRRAINVTASVDESRGNANEVMAAMEEAVLPGLVADYPGLRWSYEGQGREQRDTVRDLVRGFLLALIAIYALMAVPFRSYGQPLIVMLAIPFGLVGAVWGHVIMGLDLTILSFFGLVALTGVVVNDSLVLVDFINQERRRGVALFHAVRSAGQARFRAVLLTTATTFAGLTPLLLERSVQAKFLIPMAVSLGFGVVFSTFISLVLVPSGYLVFEDLKWFLRFLFGSDAPHPLDDRHVTEEESYELEDDPAEERRPDAARVATSET